MSTISASTTTTTGFTVDSDTTGALVLKTGASPTTAMTIDGSQNVGIGTSSPTNLLHVSTTNAGANNFNLRLMNLGTTVSTAVSALLTNKDAGNNNISSAITSTTTDATSSAGGTALSFSTTYLGALTEKARIDSSGNLLVGTTTAFAKLAVNGGISPVAAPSSVWGLDFAPSSSSGTYVTLANNATYDLATGSGMVFLFEDAGTLGLAQFACYYGNTGIVWQSGASYSNTSGTASKVNLYYNGGTNLYRIQNLTGSSKSIYVSTMRLRANT